MNIFAAFVIARPQDRPDLVAATTRPGSKALGFPGGKVDPGETPWQAALREAKEEGFEVELLSKEPIHVENVDNRPVAWYAATMLSQLPTFKEQGRIQPKLVSLDLMVTTGMGNARAMAAYLQFYETSSRKKYLER